MSFVVSWAGAPSRCERMGSLAILPTRSIPAPLHLFFKHKLFWLGTIQGWQVINGHEKITNSAAALLQSMFFKQREDRKVWWRWSSALERDKCTAPPTPPSHSASCASTAEEQPSPFCPSAPVPCGNQKGGVGGWPDVLARACHLCLSKFWGLSLSLVGKPSPDFNLLAALFSLFTRENYLIKIIPAGLQCSFCELF